MEIVVVKMFEDLPQVVQSEDGKIYQLNYIDNIGRFRCFKELIAKEHNGSLYYTIERNRYSAYRLQSIAKSCYKRIDLTKKVIKN